VEREETERRETAAGAATGPARGLSYSAMDAVVGAAVVLIGIVMMVDNHRIGADWGDDGPQTGYFPFHIGAILCIAGVLDVRGPVQGAAAEGAARSPARLLKRWRGSSRG